MNISDKFEKVVSCCNPHKLHNSRAMQKSLRKATESNIKSLNMQGIFSVTTKMFLCSRCRKHKIEPESDDELKSPEAETESPNFEENMASKLHPSSSSSSTPNERDISSEDSISNKYKSEKLSALVNLLGIQNTLPKLSRCTAGTSNYREASTQGVYREIMDKIRKLFPNESMQEKENFKEVSCSYFYFK